MYRQQLIDNAKINLVIKFLIVSSLLFCVISLVNIVQADEITVASELQTKLEQISNYQAEFQQTVKDKKGKITSSSSGKFYIKRPSLFRMETTQPEENLIVSDGSTIWFYDPFVQQVTANWTKNVVDNSPFILLTTNDAKYWAQYRIKKVNEWYVFTPKNKRSELKQFKVEINDAGIIQSFLIEYKNKQINTYTLSRVETNTKLATKLFKFKLPKKVELDDQRN